MWHLNTDSSLSLNDNSIFTGEKLLTEKIWLVLCYNMVINHLARFKSLVSDLECYHVLWESIVAQQQTFAPEDKEYQKPANTTHCSLFMFLSHQISAFKAGRGCQTCSCRISCSPLLPSTGRYNIFLPMCIFIHECSALIGKFEDKHTKPKETRKSVLFSPKLQNWKLWRNCYRYQLAAY